MSWAKKGLMTTLYRIISVIEIIKYTLRYNNYVEE